MLVFRVISCFIFFFFKQKTAYEMRISDWSSDVCSSDLGGQPVPQAAAELARAAARPPDDVAAPISSSAAAIHAAECPGDIAGRRLHRIPAQQHGPVALLRCGGVQRRHIVLREGEGDVGADIADDAMRAEQRAVFRSSEERRVGEEWGGVCK